MDTALFDYELPASAIAQTPADRRDQSRLLVVDRANRTVSHHTFDALPSLLETPRAFVRNNARVLRARLFAHRPTGGKVECLLLRPADTPDHWWCLVRPGRKLPIGATFALENAFSAEIVARAEDGTARVAFIRLTSATDMIAVAEQVGEIPLPPYIRREAEDPRRALDAERYNTVYADPSRTVAAAAPTAGLHFTPEIIRRLEADQHHFHDVTLHVGLDTFRPIASETVEAHEIHRETYEVPASTRSLITDPKKKSLLAVGTTSMRTIEDFARKAEHAKTSPDQPYFGEADIFIYPPAHFRTDALLTNFHLPRSTLLCLVSAFLAPGSTDGIDWLLEIYRSALALGYRFYSYGDAMLIR